MKELKLLTVMCSFILLYGCSEGTSLQELKDKVEKKKQSVVGQVDPIPQFKENENYYYKNVNLRNPFEYTAIESKKVDDRVFTDVKPDGDRKKEELESIDIERFKMVGTIKKGNGQLEAIIDYGSGSFKIVQVGNYLGKNNGKIVSINNDSIDLTEIVPNGSFRWLERPYSIKLTKKDE